MFSLLVFSLLVGACVTTETGHLDRLGQLGEFEQDSNTDSKRKSNTNSHSARNKAHVARQRWTVGACASCLYCARHVLRRRGADPTAREAHITGLLQSCTRWRGVLCVTTDSAGLASSVNSSVSCGLLRGPSSKLLEDTLHPGVVLALCDVAILMWPSSRAPQQTAQGRSAPTRGTCPLRCSRPRGRSRSRSAACC